ncbi:MAG: ATP-binding protein [Hyphomonas sp.]|nr:ATP-binding protein [Hyphomonas sp.]MAU68014.1 ATP-binding protein [Hyphomonas sp.]MBM56860.1 ATP-binding protein [Hyphomonas sp.]
MQQQRPQESGGTTSIDYSEIWEPLSRRRVLDWKEAGAKGQPRLRKFVEYFPFLLTCREAQVNPPGGWRTWLFQGGRGAGKTRAGAEWVRWKAIRGAGRIALVGPTLHDVREVMIHGESGLLAIEPETGWRPVYHASRRMLEYTNGARAYVFSAEDPDSLRGPQFDAAWCDELAAWRYAEAAWDMLQMALRLGADPRALVTTTPRPTALMRRLHAAPDTVVTLGTTRENASHLAPGFLSAMEAAYGGTRLGRQELEGRIVEDPEGALFLRSRIDEARIAIVPALWDVVVAVDPPATSGETADACGIIAAGRAGNDAYVLGDASAQGLRPLDWAGRAVALVRRVGAREVIAEANQGGEMVRQVLETAGCPVPVRLVNARLSKRARALPVATLYEQGRVHHAGQLGALEDEMCAFGADGFTGSPDRVDALVWAVWALMLDDAVLGVRQL